MIRRRWLTGKENQRLGLPHLRQKTHKKKARRGPAPGAYFQQADRDDLLGVVLVRDQPYTILDRSLTSRLWEHLNSRVREAVRSKIFVPTFNEAGVRNNRFQIACTNQESFQWLRQVIWEIQLTSTGSGEHIGLELVRPGEVPKLIRASVYAPGAPTTPDFLKLLQGQNPNLFTNRWVLRHRQAVSNNTLMVFGIDGDSASILAGSDYSAHYDLGRVTFQVAHAQASSEGRSHE